LISKTPLYNLKVVLKETGLKADVVRAWEHRYDVPRPQRSAGGHRIYSDYDIATLKWLKNRQREGLSISRAVKLWKDTLADGKDPLGVVTPDRVFLPLSPNVAGTIEDLSRQWLEGCLSFDSIKAEQALNQAFTLYPVEKVCTAILQRGLHMIGEQWYLGSATVQQEHYASSLAVRRIETLINDTPRATRRQTILVGCPRGETHTFPALLLSLFLCREGLPVVYLGADIPMEQMDAALATIHPNLIILAAQRLVTAAHLREAADTLQERGIPLAYGGLIFNQHPELRKHIAGTFLGESLEEAVDKVEELLQSPDHKPAVPVDNESRILADLFQRSQTLIEQILLPDLHREGAMIGSIATANAHFGTSLSAALALGNPAYLEYEMGWIQGLLTNRHVPKEQIQTYLAAYSRSVGTVLGDAGNPISQWIDQYKDRNDSPN